MAKVEDFSHESALDPATAPSAIGVSQPKTLDDRREEARGDLARGLLWLLAFAVGGVLAFVGLGRIDGNVITQSIFPSLVALAGTALGFYFGSGKVADNGSRGSGSPSGNPSNVTWMPNATNGNGNPSGDTAAADKAAADKAAADKATADKAVADKVPADKAADPASDRGADGTVPTQGS